MLYDSRLAKSCCSSGSASVSTSMWSRYRQRRRPRGQHSPNTEKLNICEHETKMTCTGALLTGCLIAIVFILLTSHHLDSQGLYYDELHQATAAFTYLGKHPTMFNYEFHGISVLNMSYSGAIKSNIYGLY